MAKRMAETKGPLSRPPRVLRTRPVPPLPVRIAERRAVRAGWLDWEHTWLRPLMRARASQLGDGASGPPRFLVRVDEFPCFAAFDDPRYGAQASRRFYELMAEAGVRHMLAVVSQLTHRPLDPLGEGGRPLGDPQLELIELMRKGGLVSFGQHGTTHRTRHAQPRRRSELTGLHPDDLLALLDHGANALRAQAGITTRILVPPFNTFSATQWPYLSDRYDLITGGPESVELMGFHGGPLWRGEAVYLPCYEPLYGRASAMLPVVRKIIDISPGTWIPIVLHMDWEADDDNRGLRQLVEVIAPFAASWDEFMAELDTSRHV